MHKHKRGYRGGSSPLARGLPLEEADIHAMLMDHPRSRGVYSTAARASRALTGSSPLARGLREPLLGLKVDVGIIPARAGFTP